MLFLIGSRLSIGKSNSLFHRRRAPLTQPRSARRAELLKRRPRTSGTVCPWGKAKEEGQGEGRLVQTSGIVYCGKAEVFAQFERAMIRMRIVAALDVKR